MLLTKAQVNRCPGCGHPSVDNQLCGACARVKPTEPPKGPTRRVPAEDDAWLEWAQHNCRRFLGAKRVATLPARPIVIESPFVVLVDADEQQPWDFAALTTDARHDGARIIVRTKRGTLPVGDYGIVGEPGIAIERLDLADLHLAVGPARQRFVQEMEQLAKLPFAAVILEASWHQLDDEALASGASAPSDSLAASIITFIERYPVTWLTAGDRQTAATLAYRLLEQYWRDTQKA